MTGFVNLKKSRVALDPLDEAKLLAVLKRNNDGLTVDNLKNLLTGVQGFNVKQVQSVKTKAEVNQFGGFNDETKFTFKDEKEIKRFS